MVQAWVEDVILPTYLVGEPNRNPMFLEKRVYQGSSGRVYPYPVIDKIGDQAVAERHRVVFLENEYLKLMVMPDFGGRIQYAYDKTNGYPFIYHNRVIKPALVGLAGPWLSGGIEFNWPQHHRPGTYCPVDYAITDNPDGSRTLWLSEIEPMWHLKGTLGLTLYPGKALFEINIRLFNPTPLPQSFHLWTNPAMHVNEHYQSIFPPDVQAVYDHGKRDVSAFPIAHGEYYKVDYSKGVDISWYKNLPVPTSYMAARSDYDFVGGYDHGRQAGMLHVADHHVVPGKKQWVWGCGDFGRAWDRNLTECDGPYAEVMCGVFADNQPDFSWLQPLEEKQVKQFFLPYKAIGYVRNATVHAAVSLEVSQGKAKVGAYATARRRRAVVRLSHQGQAIWQKILDLAPENPLTFETAVPKRAKPQDLRLEVRSAEGELLVAYTPEPKQAGAMPDPAKSIPDPSGVAGIEALCLAGLHLEQFRHATREPEDYYREALRRDPGDIRNNNALGLLLLRRGQFARAEPCFRAAIKTQTRHNPNPQEGEPHYNLGLCLRYLGRSHEAYAALKDDRPAAIGYFNQAARQNPERCFPNSLESILALQAALRFNPRDALASYCLGNLWYDKRQVPEATACWESAARFEPAWPTVHRNLALVYFNKQHAPTKAMRALERAFELDPTDARVLFELDLLKKRIRVPPGKRLAFLNRHRKVVDRREDLLLELITLLNFFGRHEEALAILLHRQFHPWEGGEGNVTGQYVVSLVELAKRRLLSAGRHQPAAKEAIALLERARIFPPNLGEGKLHGARENPILYWLGTAWEQLGETDRAHESWRQAATGLRAPTPAVYYNDQNPETIFYQGLARQKLGRLAAAKERFATLMQFGKLHLHDQVVIDYFAVSLPEFTVFEDDLDRRNQINCRYLMALGAFGLGRRTQARQELAQVLKLDPSHLPAMLHARLFSKSSRFRLDGGGQLD